MSTELAQQDRTTVAIVGGGPAGMMLGLLLARAGIDVTVLEKYPDFFRDFRGDTVHPSTMEILDELGLIEDFKKIPHGKFQRLALREDLVLGSLAELPLKYPYIAIAPQWDFLNLIAQKAWQYASFRLLMQSEVTNVVRENGEICGVTYREAGGPEKKLFANLTVAADGRHSTARRVAGRRTHNFGAPFDVLWFRLSKASSDSDEFYFRVAPYRWIVGFDRRTYVQVAYIIPKGARQNVIADGIEEFRRGLIETMPEFASRAHEIQSFDDVKFLDVQVNRAPRWYAPGFLMIGDSAHAMSPMGGVGVNYAIQDAVAAANILHQHLQRAQSLDIRVPEEVLAKVQKRRVLPTAVIQLLQRIAQSRLVEPALHGKVSAVPAFARFMKRVPPLRRLLLRVFSVGIWQEHIQTPEVVNFVQSATCDSAQV